MLDLDKSTWTRVHFGDVATQSKEKVDPSDGSVERYVAGEHMDTDDLKIHRWGEVGDGYLGPAFHRRFRPGQILYGSRRTYLRKVAVADFDGVCANTTFVIDAKPEQISPRFLPFVMTSEPFHSHAIAESKGSVNPYVNWPDIAKYEFDLPPLNEQERIADLLWAVEQHGQRLTARIRSQQSVTEALVNDSIVRYAGHRVRPLPDLLTKLTVGVVVRPASHYTDGTDGVVALRSLNVKPYEFDLSDTVRFHPESHNTLTKSHLDEGDVVIVRTGRPGDTAVVTPEVAGSNCIDLIVARPGRDLDPHFFAMFLNSAEGRRQVLRGSAGTAQQHFNVGSLKTVRMPLPPAEEQRDAVRAWRETRSALTVLQCEAEELAHLKRAVSGRLWGAA